MGEILVARGEAPGKMKRKENRPRSIDIQGISFYSDGMPADRQTGITQLKYKLHKRKSGQHI